MSEIVSVSKLLKEVYPEFDGAISGIIKNISGLSIGETIIYTLLILLFLTFVINISLNKFGFSAPSKQKILIGFCIVFALGSAITKYELNATYKLDLLRIQVLTHMHERNVSKVSFVSLLKNIYECSEDKLNKLSSQYVQTFRRTVEEDKYYMHLISKKTLDLVREKSMQMANNFLLSHKAGTTVEELRAEAAKNNSILIDGRFMKEFLEKYPEWMIDENSSKDSLIVKRPPVTIEPKKESMVTKQTVVEMKGPKNSGY